MFFIFGFFVLGSFCLGGLTGLRTFTPFTVMAWFVHFHPSLLGGTWAHPLGTTAAVVILTLLAAGELIGDKLPRTPSRLSAPGLVGRCSLGTLTGAVFGMALGAHWMVTAIAGLVGAITGAYLGYLTRVGLVRALKSADWPIAVAEDLVAIGGSILVLSQFSSLL